MHGLPRRVIRRAGAAAAVAGSVAWLSAPAAAAPEERPVAGREYIYAVELASIVGTLDGEQEQYGVRSRVHATTRYRVAARHAGGLSFAYYADERGPGIRPYGMIHPRPATLRWRGTVTAVRTRPDPAGGEPRVIERECGTGLRPQTGSIAGEWDEGGPLFIEWPVPDGIDACGMETPMTFFSYDRTRVKVSPATMRRRRPRIPVAFEKTVRGEGGSWTLRWRGAYRLRRVYSCAPPPLVGPARRIGCISHFMRHRGPGG